LVLNAVVLAEVGTDPKGVLVAFAANFADLRGIVDALPGCCFGGADRCPGVCDSVERGHGCRWGVSSAYSHGESVKAEGCSSRRFTMAWLTALSSGALGVVIGWVIKEVVDFLKRKEAHRAELQKRFFDVQLETTLRAMQMIKTSSSGLRVMLELVRNDIAAGGNSVQPDIMVGTMQNIQEELKRVAENAAGAIALLGFFQGEELAKNADQTGQAAMVPITQKITSVFGKMAAHRAAVEALPEAQQEPTFAQNVKADEALQQDAEDARKLAVALDAKADELTAELRKRYKGVIYGFEG
jgi:hypothetical protein